MNNILLLRLLIPLLIEQSQKNLNKAREMKEPNEMYTAHMTACVIWSDYADLLMELEKKL